MDEQIHRTAKTQNPHVPASEPPLPDGNAPVRLLLIEDNPGDADLVRDALEGDVREWAIEHVSRLSDGLASLRSQRAEAVLLDLSLPDSSGLDGVAEIVGRFPEIPLVVLTGMTDAFSGTRAVQQGAQEYLIKGELDQRVLGRVLSYAIERHALAQRGQFLAVEQAARAVAERAHRRAALLADASIAASSTLEEGPALMALARVLVPRLGSRGLIERLDAQGRSVCLCKSDRPGEGVELEFIASAPDAAEALRVSCAQGARIERMYRPRPEIADVFGNGPSEAELLAVIVVPLVTRGESLGTLTLASTGRYDSDDLLLAEEIARRASGAIESARLYAQALDAIQVRDNFLSIAGHELRTPLGSILLDVHVIESMGVGAENLRSAVARIGRCAGRLNSLINDLLDVSRIRAGRFLLDRSDVDLGALVRDVADRCAPALKTAQSELRIEIDGPVRGNWDGSRLQQVVANLLQNAARYGGARPIEVSVESGDGIARLRVRDHGRGVPQADQKRIFEQFSKPSADSKSEGLGLGLWITKGIVEAHGGSIFVNSSPGAGAEFVVELPFSTPSARDGAQEGNGGKS